MRRNKVSFKNRPLRAASQQKEENEDSLLPVIENRKPKPQSVLRSSKKSLDFNKLSQKINLNIRLNDSRKEEISEIDLSFKTNKLELKLHLQSQTKSITPFKQKSNNQYDFTAIKPPERAVTPPKKTRAFKAEANDLNMRSESFATLQSNHHAPDTIPSHLNEFVSLSQPICQLVHSMKKVGTELIQNTTVELVQTINQFLEASENCSFAQFERIFAEHSKSIRQAMLMLKIGIVVIVNCFFDVHFYLSNLSNLKNILIYNQQTYLFLCELLLESGKVLENTQQVLEIQAILAANRKLQSLKKLDFWTLVRQNTELLINLYKQLTKPNRDLYVFLVNFIRNIPQCTIADNMKHLQDFTSYYFTVQQSYQGLLGIPLISVAPQPYLPDFNPKVYTLVLDMDETLIHFTDQTGHFMIRPYAQQFLQEMAQYYELVVFTAGLPDYANWVLDQVDKAGHIQYRLFRQHALQYQTQFIKDLSRLGRDLSKCIIVDNVADNFQNQPDNGIFIKAWYSDEKDTALAELGPILKQIVQQKSEDVRIALKQFRSQLQFTVQLPQI